MKTPKMTAEVTVDVPSNRLTVYITKQVEGEGLPEAYLFSFDKREAISLASDIARCVKALRDPLWNQF